MSDAELTLAIAELQEVVRCRCDEAYRDRGLKDPHCECDSAEAVKIVANRIKSLTEQLAAARQDATEAEAYAEELEKELNICRMAQVVMENGIAEAEKERDEANKRGDAWRFRADIAEVKLAECEARLGKAVEALRPFAYEIDVPAMSDDRHISVHVTLGYHRRARTTLAEIESSEAVTLEGEKT